ncbi:MAG: hypothetical protein ACM3O6_03105 [Acidobacteriota bacterium]
MKAKGPVALESAWALECALAHAARCDAIVVFDVLSFCTAVDIALSRGAEVIPMGPRRPGLEALAAASSAILTVAAGSLTATLESTESGQELIAAGFADDVRWAAQYDVSGTVAILEQGVLRDLRLGGASWAR